MDHLFQFVTNHPFLIGTFVLLLALLLRLQSNRSGRNVGAQELVNLVNHSGAVILDVREPKEYEDGHIVDAINIPQNAIESRLSELNDFKDKPVIVVCKMGQSAGITGTALHKAGFQQVRRLSGGMAEWRNQNLPVVKGRSRSTNKPKAKDKTKDKPKDKKS